MSKTAQFAAISAPLILDQFNRPYQPRYSLGAYGMNMGTGRGDYEAARNNRERTLYGAGDSKPRPESEMLPMRDRLSIIAYLRRSVRNNPVMAALAFRYALSVGSPTIHVVGPDGGLNDLKERELERRLRSIVYGKGWSFRRMNKVLSTELLICNEAFIVDVEDKVQLIPSELCGSPFIAPINEIEGIGYDLDSGAPVYYRFGKRLLRTSGQSYVTFLEEEGATIVPAEFVTHLGAPDRIEEGRPVPRMSSVIDSVQQLDDIIKAKVTTVKNQAAMSVVFKKNFDPQMWADNSALKDACEENAGPLLSQLTARSNYQAVRNGQMLYVESGEEVELLEPKLNAQDFNQFSLMLVDRICAPVGIPPEEVLIGYRLSNYSSARVDRIKMGEMLDDERKEREHFFDKLIERQIGIAVDSGELENKADGIADIRYGWPVIKEIDEAKHMQAQALAKTSGLKSPATLAAENGTYADEITRGIVAEAAYKAKTIKAFASLGGRYPTDAEIHAQVVTVSEIVANMPNAEAASEALKAIAASEAAAVNADANSRRADAVVAA